MKFLTISFIVATLANAYSAGAQPIPTAGGAATYKDSLLQWQHERDLLLVSDASPLNLVSLLSLEEGSHTFGSAADNQLVFASDKLPAKAGSFLLKDNTVSFTAQPGLAFQSNVPAASATVLYPSRPLATVRYGSLSWFITRYGNAFSVRVLDTASAYRAAFTGVQRYPIDSQWKFPGRFTQYGSLTARAIPNVLGRADERTVAGIVSFEYNGKLYELEAFDAGDNLFISFSDLTGNDGSYAFRFLYIPKPGKDGLLTVDFNKATNPNCAFSPVAPCPLPPAKNRLDFPIPAGEKKYTGK